MIYRSIYYWTFHLQSVTFPTALHTFFLFSFLLLATPNGKPIAKWSEEMLVSHSLRLSGLRRRWSCSFFPIHRGNHVETIRFLAIIFHSRKCSIYSQLSLALVPVPSEKFSSRWVKGSFPEIGWRRQTNQAIVFHQPGRTCGFAVVRTVDDRKSSLNSVFRRSTGKGLRERVSVLGSMKWVASGIIIINTLLFLFCPFSFSKAWHRLMTGRCSGLVCSRFLNIYI